MPSLPLSVRPPRRGGPSVQPELTLPPAALSLIRRSIRDEVGDLSATRILQNAGFATGSTLFSEFEAELQDSSPEARTGAEAGTGAEEGPDPRDLDEARFWSSLNRFFGARGWGRVESARVHPGLGVIHAFDWTESNPAGDEDQPGCHFTAGLFSYMLSQLAGQAIAVLEVACRSAGDEHCSFLYGSEAAVHEVYGLLLDDTPLDEALARL